MAQNSKTTIPYNQFQFKDISISIDGNPVALLEGITYEVNQPKTPVYKGGKVAALQTENTDITGIITMQPSELRKYMWYFSNHSEAKRDGLEFNMSQFLDQYFTVIAHYGRRDVTSQYEFKSVTETFVNCKFHSTSMSALQGQGVIPVEMAFTCCEMNSSFVKGSGS